MAILATLAVLACHGAMAGVHQFAPGTGLPGHLSGMVADHEAGQMAGSPGAASAEHDDASGTGPIGALALLLIGLLWFVRRLRYVRVSAAYQTFRSLHPPIFQASRHPPSRPGLQVFQL